MRASAVHAVASGNVCTFVAAGSGNNSFFVDAAAPFFQQQIADLHLHQQKALPAVLWGSNPFSDFLQATAVGPSL